MFLIEKFQELIRKIINKFLVPLLAKGNFQRANQTLVALVRQIFSGNEPTKVELEYLFNLQKQIDHLINKKSVTYYNGKHPKHHLWTGHYQFILDHVQEGDVVFDVGTGASSSYTHELARCCKQIDCCDVREDLVKISRQNNPYENLEFLVMDITKELPDKHYDVVIMSHILEHLEHPEKVLEHIKKITKKIIIRLPRYDDHWMYLVKKDLGLFYCKDADHKREYVLEYAVELVKSCGWYVEIALNDIDIKILATR